MKQMQTAWIPSSILVGTAALWLAAGGCGGSGSSGFDVSPASEAQAIARAIARQECVAFESDTFCGSGVETDIAAGGHASVDFEAPADVLLCEGQAAGDTCTTTLAITPRGFPSSTTFLAAASETESGPWTLAETVPGAMAGGAAPSRDVSVMLPVPTQGGGAPTSLLIAVLVYAGAPPSGLPARAERLAIFTADLVYVSPRLRVATSPAARGGP
jgi:hypothetical protein